MRKSFGTVFLAFPKTHKRGEAGLTRLPGGEGKEEVEN